MPVVHLQGKTDSNQAPDLMSVFQEGHQIPSQQGSQIQPTQAEHIYVQLF